MEQELGYKCPQTKKQCDDECCVSAEDCHAEAINNIISNCEPEQLNQNKMTAVEWLVKNMSNKHLGAKMYFNSNKELVEQAKEMEKQQMCQFAFDYQDEFFNNGKVPPIEQYYKETFKSE